MAVSKETQSNNRYREFLIKKLMSFCSCPEIGGGEEWVRRTASNSFGFMFVNDNGDEGTVKVTVSFPRGSRDGEPYDYEAEADEYKIKCERRQIKKKKMNSARQRKSKPIRKEEVNKWLFT